MTDYNSAIKADSAPSRGFDVAAGKKPPEKLWRFSFAYWREIENFQIGALKSAWFVSLLKQLQLLSTEKFERVLSDRSYKQNIRYHPINWNAKNIPIAKEDINWVGDILSSPDVEICQFQISKANGRIVGFFDGDNIFNILLLDPNHNAQPSKYNDYKIRATPPSSCQLAEAIVEFRRLAISFDLDISSKVEILRQLYEGPCNMHHPSILIDLREADLDLIFKYLANGTITNLEDLFSAWLHDLEK